MHPSFATFGSLFVVFAQPTTSAQPGQRTLYHPPARQHLKLVAIRFTFHHGQQPIASDPRPHHQPARVACIRPNDPQPGKSAQQFGQHQLSAIPVLNVGGMNHHGQEQPHGVHYDVALASGNLFTRVIASGPPFSVVFTDWLSMMAALGVASRPAASRTRARKAASTRSQVPSSRQFRKYHHTVPHGGRHGASAARVCRPVARRACRSPLPASPWFWDVLWFCRAAAGKPILPIGHRSNRWGMLFYSFHQRIGHPTLTPSIGLAGLAHCHTPS